MSYVLLLKNFCLFLKIVEASEGISRAIMFLKVFVDIK